MIILLLYFFVMLYLLFPLSPKFLYVFLFVCLAGKVLSYCKASALSEAEPFFKGGGVVCGRQPLE